MSNLISEAKQDTAQLYELMRDLREQGIGREIDLPEIVVCGSQSSGKSTVLSRLTGFTLPSHEGLCTRFPTRLTLKPNPALNAAQARYSASIQAHRTTPRAKAEAYKKFNEENASGQLNGSAAVADWIREVTVLMDLEVFEEGTEVNLNEDDEDDGQPDGSSPRFSYDVFCLEIEGPFSQDLTVIDLPGIFEASETGRQSKSDIKYVRGMVTEYVSRENTVVLAVMDAGRDMLTQQVLSFLSAIELDSKKRLEVMAVVTKPDREPSDFSRGRLIKQINEGTIKVNGHRVSHGWHVLRNFEPSGKETDPIKVRTELINKEQEFFGSAEWQSLKPELTGIKRFTKKLHVVQLELNMKSLPTVDHQIETRLQEIDVAVGQLKNPSTEDEMNLSSVDDILYDMLEFLQSPRQRRELSDKFSDDRLNLRASFDRVSAQYRKALTETVEQCFNDAENINIDNLTTDARARLEICFKESIDFGLRWQVHPKYVDEVFRAETRNWKSLSSTYTEQLARLFEQHIEALLTLHSVFQPTFPAFRKYFLSAALKRLKSDLKNETAFGTDPHDLDSCEKPVAMLLKGFPDAIATYCQKSLDTAWRTAQAENSLDLTVIGSRMFQAARADEATATILIDTGIRSFCEYYKDQLERLRAADGETSIRAKIDERIRSVFSKEDLRTIRRDEKMKQEFTPAVNLQDSTQYQELVATAGRLRQARQTLQQYLPAKVLGANKRNFNTANDGGDVVMTDIDSKRVRKV